jgi:hypothetical protein
LYPISSSAFCVCCERSYVENGSRSDVDVDEEDVATPVVVEFSLVVVRAGTGGVVDEVEASFEQEEEEGSGAGESFVCEDITSSCDFEEDEELFRLDLLFFLERDIDVDSASAAMVSKGWLD